MIIYEFILKLINYNGICPYIFRFFLQYFCCTFFLVKLGLDNVIGKLTNKTVDVCGQYFVVESTNVFCSVYVEFGSQV